MNAATMRQRLRTRVAGQADGWSDAQVDVLLNQIYRGTIPNLVDGMLSDGEWTKDTIAGMVEYQLPATVHSPRVPVYVDGVSIATSARRDQFWASYDADTTTTGPPQAALFYGGGDSTEGTHMVRVYPVPDAVYTLTGAARVYPSDNIAEKTNGMDDTHALAVIARAAQEFALDYSLDEIAKREGERFAALLSQLRVRSSGPAQEARFRRTF
jgi:hypothetical protein